VDAANALADELLAAWVGDGSGAQLESVDGAWVLTGLGRREELEAAIQRSRAQTLWHDAARRIASGDAVASAETYAVIGSVPDESYARLRGRMRSSGSSC
jgi:hypothetical protein